MSAHVTPQSHGPVNEILARLAEGNRRFTEGEPRVADSSPKVRSGLAGGQAPAVAVLACSDSRVGPELLFDQGLGELFVVRVAGNVLDYTVLGSLEYAVEHLGVALILVMGHSSCGAVTSACSRQPGEFEGATGVLLQAILPAVEVARQECDNPEDLIDRSAKLNVVTQAQALSVSPVIRRAIAHEQLTVQGAWYDLATGVVSWL